MSCICGEFIVSRPSITSAVQIVSIDEKNDRMWLRLAKRIGLDQDLYICAAYFPPEGASLYSKAAKTAINIFEDLQEEATSYRSKGNVLIAGDLNARAGILQEEICTSVDTVQPTEPLASGVAELPALPMR